MQHTTDMRRTLLLLILCAMAPCLAIAQDAASGATAVRRQHISFEGIPVKGDIYEFADALRQAGYKLQKRDGDTRSFVFKGTVFGTTQVFRVSYTKRTRTVYRILAQPHNMPSDVLLDSLRRHYGEPADAAGDRIQWQLPTGAVMLATPDGYNPTFVIMDAVGVAAYTDEDK